MTQFDVGRVNRDVPMKILSGLNATGWTCEESWLGGREQIPGVPPLLSDSHTAPVVIGRKATPLPTVPRGGMEQDILAKGMKTPERRDAPSSFKLR